MNNSIRSKKRLSPGALTIGIVLVIVGSSSIGYIPGKPMLISLIGIVIVAIGLLIAAVCFTRHRQADRSSYRRN